MRCPGFRTRLRRRTQLLVAVLSLCALQLATGGAADAAQCVASGPGPRWIDYADRFVPFRGAIFRKPGITAAVSNPGTAWEMRQGGARTVFWDMHLNKRVGTPRRPADPQLIDARADRLYEYAVSVTACAAPVIALNELQGAQLEAPWSETNRQYRANVLGFLRRLSARGARPALFVSHPPATERGVARWWRNVAKVSDIVREVYVPAPRIAALGAVRGSRLIRHWIRFAIADFTAIGIRPARLGIALGFHSTPGVGGGRDGLEPSSAWFEAVKLQALAARRVASQLQLATIWSWGWAVFAGRPPDADKPKAACVYLWARDPALCDGPRAAGPGFNASRSQGQAERPGILLDVLSVRGSVVSLNVLPIGWLSGHRIELQRRSSGAPWIAVRKLVLPVVAPSQLRIRVPRGWTSLRVVVMPRRERGRVITSGVRNVRVALPARETYSRSGTRRARKGSSGRVRGARHRDNGSSRRAGGARHRDKGSSRRGRGARHRAMSGASPGRCPSVLL